MLIWCIVEVRPLCRIVVVVWLLLVDGPSLWIYRTVETR